MELKLCLAAFSALGVLMCSCGWSGSSDKSTPPADFTGAPGEVVLMTLDPGHFHAGLVQKAMYPQIASTAYVYAPEGPDVETHLARIRSFNMRADNPTNWNLEVYTGPDYLERMLRDRPGNLLMVAGNNRRKIEYIAAAVNAGIHVLADKPMCIDRPGFEQLARTIETATEQCVLLADIMTERHEITTIIQRELSLDPDVFGTFHPGSPDNPAVTKESVHHLFKYVAGEPIKRPAWFFDTTVQGEGLVDVTTHLVDMVMWGCFPEESIDYQRDITLVSANRWPTMITREQFTKATRLPTFTDKLIPQLDANGVLPYFCNGEVTFTIRGIHAKTSVIWNFQAPEGGGDTHFSIMRGTNASLVIRQGQEQGYTPELYVEPAGDRSPETLAAPLENAVKRLSAAWPGIGFEPAGEGWRITIPDRYRVGHEAHFEQVTERYLRALVNGSLPDWEVPNMLAKYHLTTSALDYARGSGR